MAGRSGALAVLAARRVAAQQAMPLACARLWDREHPRTSQRRALAALTPTTIAHAIFGGNRSGKTEAAMMLAVAFALGRSDPGAQAWCRANGLDPARLPAHPGRVMVSAVTHDDSRRYHRPKLERYCPPGTTFRYWSARDTAEARLPNGGLIITKANEQGRAKYQGDAFDLVLLDEEHDEEVYQECLLRIVDRPGAFILLSMTPLSGLTWVYYTFVKPDTADRERAVALGQVSHMFIHGEDNPWVSAEKLAEVLRSFGPLQRAARAQGQFVPLEGRIYTRLSRELHVRPPPAELGGAPLLGGLDFGFRNPCALVIALHDERDDTLYIVAEYEVAQRTMARHAQAWRELIAGLVDWMAPELGAQVLKAVTALQLGEAAGVTLEEAQETVAGALEWVAADPEDAQARRELADQGFSTIPAVKEFKAGVEAVAARLEPDVAGRPHLFVAPWCVKTLTNLENLRWKPSARGQKEDGREAQIKQDDHLADAVRYLVLTLARQQGVV